MFSGYDWLLTTEYFVRCVAVRGTDVPGPGLRLHVTHRKLAFALSFHLSSLLLTLTTT